MALLDQVVELVKQGKTPEEIAAQLGKDLWFIYVLYSVAQEIIKSQEAQQTTTQKTTEQQTTTQQTTTQKTTEQQTTTTQNNA